MPRLRKPNVFQNSFFMDYPANTSELPAATLVQPVTASPTLPQPKLFIKTVVDPVAIGAAWEGQGLPGSK
jgi:hypothetical protein